MCCESSTPLISLGPILVSAVVRGRHLSLKKHTKLLIHNYVIFIGKSWLFASTFLYNLLFLYFLQIQCNLL